MSPDAVKHRSFWRGRDVLVTGHTGFKGAWLCLWLHALGARVTGYALDPPTEPSLFSLARVDRLVHSVLGDVRDGALLARTVASAEPEIVFHLAAQPLVRESYLSPVETYAVNVMGTVNLLDAVRRTPSVRAVVNVTTDKCYENRELDHPFQEEEALGGYDPYSSSKACSELVTAAWRSSFFNPSRFGEHRVSLATARAGNVIGGGDWAQDRLVPDCVAALVAGEPVRIRNPHAIRPWQHVLEPLSGYLTLARLLYERGAEYAGAWNFGPLAGDARPVEWIVARMCNLWGDAPGYRIDAGEHPHEAGCLKLDIAKATTRLGWSPRWDLDGALAATIEWVHAWRKGDDVAAQTLAQIERYQSEVRGGALPQTSLQER